MNDYLAKDGREMEEASKNYNFSLTDFSEARDSTAQEILNMKEMCWRVMRREHGMHLVKAEEVHYAFPEKMVNQLMMHAYLKGIEKGDRIGFERGHEAAYDTIRELVN